MRILFVDDEEHVLRGLERLMSTLEGDWLCDFVTSGAEALAHLKCDEFDVVVTDLRMPQMEGAALLRAIQLQYAHVVRVVLSGQAGQQASVTAAGAAHQFLSKPCECETLLSMLQRADVIRNLIAEPRLRGLVSELPSLPSVPTAYKTLISELDQVDVSMERVCFAIASDVAMSAKVLQLVNSSFFGLSRAVMDVRQAVMFLGLSALRALIVAAQAFCMFPPSGDDAATAEAIQAHSLAVSAAARRIAVDAGHSTPDTDAAAVAGMLHEIGALAIAAIAPVPARQIAFKIRGGANRWQAERDTLGTTHAEVGAYLLGTWGLPLKIVHGVAGLASPTFDESEQLSVSVIVHLADAFVQGAASDAEQYLSLIAPSITDSPEGSALATRIWDDLTLATAA